MINLSDSLLKAMEEAVEPNDIAALVEALRSLERLCGAPGAFVPPSYKDGLPLRGLANVIRAREAHGRG